MNTRVLLWFGILYVLFGTIVGDSPIETAGWVIFGLSFCQDK